jgi:hypothetical protein
MITDSCLTHLSYISEQLISESECSQRPFSVQQLAFCAAIKLLQALHISSETFNLTTHLQA